ncbi:MAG: hypothetical protein R3Y50_01790 [Rikenellaceae bacterium]
MKRNLLTIICLLFSLPLFAQMNMSANFQNMHLWRGGEVADGFVLTTDVSYTTLNKHLEVGLWGGTNSKGEYKEFNYYATYSSNGFSLTLFDTYNFSDGATYNNSQFFNYIPDETGRFLDATAAYRFSGKFPIMVSWSTVLFGRDRDSLNEKNRFSTFCYAEYPIYKKDNWVVDVGLGAVFALNNIDNSANFYGDKAGIVHATLKVSNTVEIANYELPLYMQAMWNPQSDKAYLMLGVQLFSF